MTKTDSPKKNPKSFIAAWSVYVPPEGSDKNEPDNWSEEQENCRY